MVRFRYQVKFLHILCSQSGEPLRAEDVVFSESGEAEERHRVFSLPGRFLQLSTHRRQRQRPLSNSRFDSTDFGSVTPVHILGGCARL